MKTFALLLFVLVIFLGNSYGQTERVIGTSSPRPIIPISRVQGIPPPTPDYVSDVDKDIPKIDRINPNRYALVIGNENYYNYNGTQTKEPNVDYAINDAAIFYKYAISAMGIDPNNIIYDRNATSATMRSDIKLVSQLMEPNVNTAELIFYYAGHGYPDQGTNAPYLIPVDVNPANLESAIRLSEVYTKFGEMGARSVTVFLDACFSGVSRNGEPLIRDRGIRIRPRNENLTGNMVVFSAASGIQVALPYREQQHGMFTYFLLKKMQETNGQFTLGQLAEYLSQNVRTKSINSNKISQEPEVQVSPAVENTWRNWKFQ